MSSNHNNTSNRQRLSRMSHHKPCINNAAHQPFKLTSIALLLGGASLVLTGCQSSPTASPKSSSSMMMDFRVADTAVSQEQGRAFNASMNAKAEQYAQLFDQAKYPNSENQAKSHLLAAIRQHLTTEHVAVARANYQSVPFIDADSIDAGSSSLLKTVIETYMYQPKSTLNDSEYEDTQARAKLAAVSAESNKCNDNEDDDAYEVCVTEGIDDDDAEDSLESDYPSDYYKSRAEAEAERNAIAAILAEAGENELPSDSNDDSQYAGEYDYDDEADSAFSSISKTSPKSWSKNYEAMQMAKQQPDITHDNQLPRSSAGAVGQLLGMFHRTPEQIAASNAYQYQNLTFNSVSQYRPQLRQLQSVYSYDYVTPTISSSVQIPLEFDFNRSSVTVDPSAIMPIVALVNPENTPLPTQMTSHTMRFGLPDKITEQLPPAVIYDSVLNAIQSSMAELAPEHFSAVDIRDDAFAKEVGASRAVKVYFGSQQSGEMIGRTLKYVMQSLQEYVDANPNKYPDGAVLKAALAKIQLYNKGYQSADVGSLLQLIEAIGPISFNQINYYYLDSSDRLLAKQQRLNIGGDLIGSTTTMLNQIRYDQASFESHALTPLLAESFGPNAVPPIDGNVWLAEQRQQTDRLQEARYARYDYSDRDLEEGYDSDKYGTDEYGADKQSFVDEAIDDTESTIEIE